LLDTNILLEFLLDQEKADDVEHFSKREYSMQHAADRASKRK